MNNKYVVSGDVTTIFLNRKDGTVFEAEIDTDQLQKVQAVEGSFYPMYHKATGTWYARCDVVKPEGGHKLVLLHRLIAETPKGMGVAHKDGNGLNCRRSNLINKSTFTSSQVAIQEAKEREEAAARAKAQAERDQKKAAKKAGKATEPPADAQPVRGVTWHKATGRWYASGFHEGKRYVVGYFEPGDWRKANTAMEAFRAEGPSVVDKIKTGVFNYGN